VELQGLGAVDGHTRTVTGAVPDRPRSLDLHPGGDTHPVAFLDLVLEGNLGGVGLRLGVLHPPVGSFLGRSMGPLDVHAAGGSVAPGVLEGTVGHVRIGVGVGIGVRIGIRVRVRIGVGIAVGVRVGIGIGIGVGVAVGVGVSVGFGVGVVAGISDRGGGVLAGDQGKTEAEGEDVSEHDVSCTAIGRG